MKAFQQHEDKKKVEEAHVLLMLRKHIFDQEINCSGQSIVESVVVLRTTTNSIIHCEAELRVSTIKRIQGFGHLP